MKTPECCPEMIECFVWGDMIWIPEYGGWCFNSGSRDQGYVMISMKFCPFCGKSLPTEDVKNG